MHKLPAPMMRLADGAMEALGGESYLVTKGELLRWSFDGYHRANASTGAAMLLTPPSTLRALDAGYRPMLHPSAEQKA
jgi:hypothetical protein